MRTSLVPYHLVMTELKAGETVLVSKDYEKNGTFMARILVVDDDNQFRAMLRQLLERFGYEVEEAGDGEEAILVHRRRPVSLIITDIIMPRKDGTETIMELKADYPELNIIAVSGGGCIGAETYLEIAEAFGATRILEKPINVEELLACVRDLLEKEREN